MQKLNSLRVLFAAVCASSAWSAQAFCGFYAGKADSSLFNEASQVLMVRDGNRTVISMLNDYKGDLKEFALIVPTPVSLQKGQVRIAERASFDRIDAYSSPRLAEYFDNDPCQFRLEWGNVYRRDRMMYPPPAPAPAPLAARAASADRAKALGVTVEVQYTLGEYDIVSLSATQSDGLETWLRENGYRIPQGASSALKPYINQGMKFFVAKVNLQEQAKSGYTMLRPLQFAFESEKFMLPMRLGMLNAPPGKAQDLIIYMLTKNGRVESSNYRTAKLPANMNLPFFIKPKFQDFYKAMFESEAKKENYKVLFTEYFWDMAWCDPCAANPLSTQELRNAGVFWVGGDENEQFLQMKSINSPVEPAGAAPNKRAPQTSIAPRPMPPIMGGGAQPVVLTRLHVRYTPQSLAEDLMFTQTKDRQNWQSRYVIQQPYGGHLNQCSSRLDAIDCETQCKPRVAQLWSSEPKINPSKERGFSSQFDVETLGGDSPYTGQSQEQLQSNCMKACSASKQSSLHVARQYYEQHLPTRLNLEKQTLARLTGWGLAEIDALPDAQKYSLAQPPAQTAAQPRPAASSAAWWQKLFTTSETK